jgi:putative nucleotidyltransferase with HDIG domain
MNDIIKEVEAIIDPVYLVGGSVRDLIIGQVPHDYDFCTPLLPDEIEERVRAAGKRPYTTGKRFGTIGFKAGGQLVEVTTFRTEAYHRASRKPEVQFVDDITADLSRRDFTINAIARRGERLIDPYGGRLDILERTIKAVGKPQDRFKEDPLRMLRAARFASQLGFEIDQLTESTAKKWSYRILHVSRERWVQEMDKLLITDQPSVGLDFMARTRLLNYMIPELAIQVEYDQDSPYHELTLWEHTLSTVDKAPLDIDLRWSALLHDVGKPYVRTSNKRGYSNYIHHDMVGAELALAIGRYLKWSNDRVDKVSETIRYHLRDESPIRAADNASKSRLPEGSDKGVICM